MTDQTIAQLIAAAKDPRAVHCRIGDVWYVDKVAGTCGIIFDDDETDYVYDVPYYGGDPDPNLPILYFTFDATGVAIGTVLAGSGGSSSDTTPPSAPTNLREGMNSTPRSVDLYWDIASDNSGRVAQYGIYRCNWDGSGAYLIGMSGGNTFTDLTVSAPDSYYYTVAAFDFAGNQSAHSAVLSVALWGELTDPSNLVQLTTSWNAVTLQWTPSTSLFPPILYDVQRQIVYPRPGQDGNWHVVATTADNTYTEMGAYPNKNGDDRYNWTVMVPPDQCNYRIVAKDASHYVSQPSNQIFVQLPENPADARQFLTVQNVPFTFYGNNSQTTVVYFPGPASTSLFAQRPVMSGAFRSSAPAYVVQSSLQWDPNGSGSMGVMAWLTQPGYVPSGGTLYADLTFAQAYQTGVTIGPWRADPPEPPPEPTSTCPCAGDPPPDDPLFGSAVCTRFACHTPACPNEGIDLYMWLYPGTTLFCAGCSTVTTDVETQVC